MDPVILNTVRPFILDSISLSKTGIDVNDVTAILDLLADKVSSAT